MPWGYQHALLELVVDPGRALELLELALEAVAADECRGALCLGLEREHLLLHFVKCRKACRCVEAANELLDLRRRIGVQFDRTDHREEWSRARRKAWLRGWPGKRTQPETAGAKTTNPVAQATQDLFITAGLTSSTRLELVGLHVTSLSTRMRVQNATACMSAGGQRRSAQSAQQLQASRTTRLLRTLRGRRARLQCLLLALGLRELGLHLARVAEKLVNGLVLLVELNLPRFDLIRKSLALLQRLAREVVLAPFDGELCPRRPLRLRDVRSPRMSTRLAQ